ncbi:hypothetical protein ACR78J_21725, partial [Sphingobacterium spiritivorum]
MKKHSILVLLSCLAVATGYAQQKIGDGSISGASNLPNKDAILELSSKYKGLLFSRVELQSTTNPAPLQSNQHVAGMMVYNTVKVGDVSPGIYYNDGNKWIAVGNSYGAINITYNPSTFEMSFIDVNGNPVTINLKDVVKANETLTTLAYDNISKVLTYTDEKGKPNTINISALVTGNETLTVLSYDATANTLTYKDEKGTINTIDISNLVKNNETLTTLAYDNTTKILTYTDEKGDPNTINISALVTGNETLTVLSYDATANTLT